MRETNDVQYRALLVNEAEIQMIQEMFYFLTKAIVNEQKRCVIPLDQRFSQINRVNLVSLTEKLTALQKPMKIEL